MDYTKDTDILKMNSLLYRKMQIYINRETAKLGLSSGLLPFVIMTCENGKMPQNKFCELLGISKGTVAKMLAKLEAMGYVTRLENARDGRSIDVYPTAKALEIYPKLEEIGENWVKRMTTGMSDIEKLVFRETLIRVSNNISSFPE